MADSNEGASPLDSASIADQAVAQGGAYEVLRKRLSDQGARLRQVVEAMNQRRLQEYQQLLANPANEGRSKLELSEMAGFSSYRSFLRVAEKVE